jgi:Flp pilus assembly protein TadD
MMSKMIRAGVIALAVFVLVALTVFVAACGNSSGSTTTVSTAASSTSESTGTSAGSSDSTTTTVASTNTSTIVQGGKSADAYKAEIPDLEKKVQANPTDIASWLELAVANYNLGNYETAVTDYKNILAQENDAFTHNNLGNVYRDWGKPDQAIAEYQTAISLDPTLKPPYINLANVYKNQGDLTSAMKVLQQAEAAMSGDDKTSIQKFEQEITSTTT